MEYLTTDPLQEFLASDMQELYELTYIQTMDDLYKVNFESLKKAMNEHPLANPFALKWLGSVKLKLRGVLAWNHLRHNLLTFGSLTRIVRDINAKKARSGFSPRKTIKLETRGYNEVQEVDIGWLFSPSSSFSSIWNITVFVLMFYIFTGMPYILAFRDLEMWSPLFYFEVSIDIMFFFDIIITLNTAYKDNSGTLITSRSRIFMNYLKGMLVIDVLALLPVYLINASSSASRSNSLIRFVRVSKLTRIFRISKILTVFKHLSNSEVMNKFFRLIQTYNGITRLLSTIYIIVIMAHITACMWYFVAKLEGFSPDTWVVRLGYQDATEGRLYLACLYFSLTILTTVGFGDINAYTEAELVICIIWMLFGIGVYSFIVGTLTSVLSRIDAKEAVIKENLNMVEDFANQFGVSDHVEKQMKRWIKKGTSLCAMEHSDVTKLIHTMPKHLRHHIAMNMHGGAPAQIKFFRDKDPVFIAAVVPTLKYLELPDGSLLYSKKDLPEDINFIAKGRVSYLMAKETTVFKSLLTGSYFGEIELIERCPRYFTVITSGNCEFLVMSGNVMFT